MKVSGTRAKRSMTFVGLFSHHAHWLPLIHSRPQPSSLVHLTLCTPSTVHIECGFDVDSHKRAMMEKGSRIYHDAGPKSRRFFAY
jgi:hypothetical protein